MDGYISIDQLMGSHPNAVRNSPLPSVQRGPVQIRRYREGCGLTTLGAFSLDSIAHGLNTDTKTLLMLGGAGFLAGWLANNLSGVLVRKVKKIKRGITGGASKGSGFLTKSIVDITPVKLIGVAAAIGLYMYVKHYQHKSDQAALPPGPQA
jgi:hypothetical protein